MQPPTSSDQTLSSLPPYIIIPSIRKDKYKKLLRGGQRRAMQNVADTLRKRPNKRHPQKHQGPGPKDSSECIDKNLTMEDIRRIEVACAALGLRGGSPLEAESYEDKTRKEWKDETAGKKRLRSAPMPKEVYGDTGDEWWTNKEDVRNRDWSRTRAPEIGRGH